MFVFIKRSVDSGMPNLVTQKAKTSEIRYLGTKNCKVPNITLLCYFKYLFKQCYMHINYLFIYVSSFQATIVFWYKTSRLKAWNSQLDLLQWMAATRWYVIFLELQHIFSVRRVGGNTSLPICLLNLCKCAGFPVFVLLWLMAMKLWQKRNA